jgi:hypothetical protein
VSEARFADGLRYRIEIPSVEGPAALRAVLEEAEVRGVPVRRVSQGSGVMMLTDAEISEMAELGSEHGVEVSLFLGPRGAWDSGGQAFATDAVGGVARGQASIDWCLAEVRRGLALGIRSFLIADVGVLATLGRMKRGGDLPESLVLKTSVLLPCANPATAGTLEELGATTINVATDLSAAELGELRAACSAPLDVYVEVPDDQGGFVRYYEVPDIIRNAAPLYVKLGLRNAPNICDCSASVLPNSWRAAAPTARRIWGSPSREEVQPPPGAGLHTGLESLLAESVRRSPSANGSPAASLE